VFVRPEPEFASFFTSHQQVLEKAVGLIQKAGQASVAVLPRTASQERKYSRMGVATLDESMTESPVAHSDIAIGAAETMLMEAFILGKPAVSAIYWEPSKPVMELHKYIPHSVDPKEIAMHVENFLGEGQMKAFQEKASLLVQNMDNPVEIMIEQLRKLNQRKEGAVTKRRSKMEIYIDIIQAAALHPLRPTHMMKAANISYNELRVIVEALSAKGLIGEENTLGGKYYQATKEGLKLLQDYKELHTRLFSG
jgi:predicted transcriptional regulator